MSGTCRSSSGGKENGDDDLAVASEEGSVSSAGGHRDVPLGGRGGNSSPRELVQELIDENTRLYEENKKLGERYVDPSLPPLSLKKPPI